MSPGAKMTVEQCCATCPKVMACTTVGRCLGAERLQPVPGLGAGFYEFTVPAEYLEASERISPSPRCDDPDITAGAEPTIHETLSAADAGLNKRRIQPGNDASFFKEGFLAGARWRAEKEQKT